MRRQSRKGIAMVFLYFAMVGFFIVLGSFIIRGVGESRITSRKIDEIQAYYLAEAGIDQVKRGLYDAFRSIAANIITADFGWFDSLPDPNKYVLPSNSTSSTVDNGIYSVNITNVSSLGEDRDITLVSTATVNNISKTITAVICYGSRPAEVFDYSYFINNFGWLWGNTITSQGDIRSNGDFSFGVYTPDINGDVYASENEALGANGDIIGTNDSDNISDYRDDADLTARPTNPTAVSEDVNGNGILDLGEDTNGNGILDDFNYPYGYDGESEHFAQQKAVSMPYLGDLDYYKEQAISEEGKITQCGTILVDNKNNIPEDEDNVVLIGTDACPIEISGPVVVIGDVLIKGVVKGQGTIFSGRNTHIMGNITYENPPAWAKPDADPNATDAVNAEKDFLGLATKGNMVIGDYTSSSWDWIKNYLKPPFTQKYATDSSDDYLGYDSDGNPDNGYWFNGDYTALDGGQKLDGSNRKFYESSYDDDYFSDIADKFSKITQIDAITYTNHVIAGRVGQLTINGTIVSRDEAIGYSGNITMNYDLRAQSGQMADNFYLPRQLNIPRTKFFYISEN